MKEQFKLIDGIFSAADAKEVLLMLLEEKIKFHGLKSFSDEVRTGNKNRDSLARIAELEGIKNTIVRALTQDSENSDTFYIKSYIKISN